MKKYIFLLIALALFSSAAYTGPANRTSASTNVIWRTTCLSTQYVGTPPVWRYRTWDNVYAAPGSPQALNWQTNYPEAPEHTHCHSGLDGDHGWGYGVINLGSYDPVSVSYSLNCTTPGNADWCRDGLNLSLTASEPIPGHVVRYFETSAGMLCDPADAVSVTCTTPVTLEGTQSGSFWAVSSYGDTSLMRSYSWKLDAIAPVNTSSVTAPDGAHGWHTTDVIVLLSGADTTSGIDPASFRYQLNNGDWHDGANLTVAGDGVHTVHTEVRDMAGNVGTRAITISLDKTPPVISHILPNPDGLNGWFVTHPIIPLAALDDLSGLEPGSLRYRLNSLDWTVSESAPLLEDGYYIVEVEARDLAGNTGSMAFEVRVDTTAPTLDVTVTSDASQQNGWYGNPVTATALASDATSGLSVIEYQVDATSWVSGSSLTLEDGVYNLTMRASDGAGNQTETTRIIQVDSLAPASAFDSISGPVSGIVLLLGSSADAVSGLAQVEFSLDGGLAWKSLVYAADGKWSISYDTTTGPDGQHTILVRATDNAGHSEMPVSLNVTVNNAPPKVSLSEWWWIWESGATKVDPGITPLESVRLQIACGNLPDVVLKFNDLEKLPSTFSWDRRCGNGTLAASGDYTVTLTACNINGKCASAQGVIRIPEGQVTKTPMPITTPIPEPSPTRPAVIPTAIPTQIIVLPTVPKPQLPEPVPPSWPLWLLPAGALLGVLIALGFNAASDPRPQAIRHLGNLLKRIVDEQ